MARGRARRARQTPMWVFVLHLVGVFVCTWLGMMALTAERYWIAVPLLAVWVVMFVITSLDNVRIAAFEWTQTYILVVLDTLGITGKTRRVKDSAQDKGVHDVQGEQTRPDLDVDRG